MPTYTFAMRPRSFDPLHLDVEIFSKSEGRLSGDWPLTDLERLCASADPQVPVGPEERVTWRLEGERRSVRGKEPEVWLTLSAQAGLSMTCQRCLQPLPVALDVRNSLQFVDGEDAAAALDADGDDDVLALTRSLNAKVLVEDELLLALPLVPRHERCPEPLLPAAGPPEAQEPARQPFAALAGLKLRRDA